MSTIVGKGVGLPPSASAGQQAPSLYAWSAAVGSLSEDLVVSGGNKVLYAVGQSGIPFAIAGAAAPSTTTAPGFAATTSIGGRYVGTFAQSYSGALLVTVGSSVYTLDDHGSMQLVAGAPNPTGASAGNGGAAVDALFSSWLGITTSPTTLFITEIWNHVIRQVSLSTSIVTHFAGTFRTDDARSTMDFSKSGVGGPAATSVLNYPWALSYSSFDDALFIADSWYHVIFRVNIKDGILQHYAGVSGTTTQNMVGGSYSGDGGAALLAQFNTPRGVAVSPLNGDVYVSDSSNHLIRRISRSTGLVTTLVGRVSGGAPVAGYSGDGGQGTNASIKQPWGLFFKPDGTLLIADTGNGIRRLSPTGIISTVFAPATSGTSDNDSTMAQAGYNVTLPINPTGPAISPSLALGFCVDFSHVVYLFNPSSGAVELIAGTLNVAGFAGDGGLAVRALLNAPQMVAFSANGDMYIADTGNNAVRKVAAISGIIITVVGSNLGMAGYRASDEGALSIGALLKGPLSVHIAPVTGDLIISDSQNNCIRRVSAATGRINSVAGQCGAYPPIPIGAGCGYNASDEGKPALSAHLNNPVSTVLSDDGIMYILDNGGMVRKVDTSGKFTRFSGVPVSPPCPYPNITFQYNEGAVVNGMNANRMTATYGLAVMEDGNVIAIASSGGIIRITPQGLVYLLSDTASSNIDSASVLNASVTRVGGIAYHPRVGVIIVGSDDNSGYVRMVPSANFSPHCPPGYFCSCGYNLAPCSNSSFYCPGNTTIPIMASHGYKTVSVPGLDGLSVKSSLAPCAKGFYCSAGSQMPCLGGSYGTTAMQANPSDCFSCPSGKYIAESGGSSMESAPTPCALCPPGTTSAGVSTPLMCFHCPPGTYSGAGAASLCQICSNGSTSFNGAASCFPTASIDGMQNNDGGFLFQRMLSVSTGDLDEMSLLWLTLSSCIPIVSISLLALFALVVTYNLCRGLAISHVMINLLAQVDQFRIEIKDDGTIESQATAVGGIATVLGIGATLALMTSSIVAYSRSNTLLQQAVMPVTSSALRRFADLPMALLTTSGMPLERLPSQGFMITIATMGNLCSQVAGSTSSLLDSAFVYKPPSSNSSDVLLLHTWVCLDCLPNDQSQFSASFHRSCQSFLVSVSTATASGGLTLTSFNYSNNNAPQLLTSLSATVPMTLEVVQDLALGKDRGDGLYTGGRSISGLLAFATTNIAAQMGSSDDRDGLMQVSINLYLQPNFVLYTMTPLATLGQLFSSLAAWAGLFGSFVILKSFYAQGREAQEHWLVRRLCCSSKQDPARDKLGGRLVGPLSSNAEQRSMVSKVLSRYSQRGIAGAEERANPSAGIN